MEEVTILIPTRFNNRWVLELNLKTIRKYTRYPYKIIIGDAELDEEVRDFLSGQNDVKVVKCPDPRSPKDNLAGIANRFRMNWISSGDGINNSIPVALLISSSFQDFRRNYIRTTKIFGLFLIPIQSKIPICCRSHITICMTMIIRGI